MKRTKLTIVLAVLASSSMALAQQDFRNSRRPGGTSSGFTGTPEQPTNSTPRAKELTSTYNNLLNTSIFARDRRSATSRVEVAAVDPPPVPENFLTLRGVGWEDGQMTAMIEDTRDNSPIRARIGDPIATGKVVSLTPSELVFETKDGLQKRHIALGSNLLGREMEPPAVLASASTPGSSASTLADLQSFFQQNRRGGGGRGGQGGFGQGGFGQQGFGQQGFGQQGFGQQGFGQQGRSQFGTAGFDPTQQRRQRGGGGFDPTQQQDATGGGGRRRQRGGGGGMQDSGFGG